MTPKWSTPERRTQLVKLFTDSGGFCVRGHAHCLNPEHHYELYIDALIADWIQLDRQQARVEWLTERARMHGLGERREPLRGRFSNIARDVWHDKQPLFYVEAIGMDGVKLKPFAKVKLSSSYLRLFVDLGNTLRGASKNQRRKAVRYGKPLPKSISETIHQKVSEAVRHYLNH